MPSPRCWNSRRQRKFSKTLYFKTAESEGNKWCSTSLKVLKIIRLPFQDRNILTWCSIWTKEWKSESKANLSSLDVGEAFSSQPIFFFINSLHLQNLTLLPYSCYYSLCPPKSSYWDQLLVKHANVPQQRQSYAFMPDQHSLVLLPNPHSLLFMSSLYGGIWYQINLRRFLSLPRQVLRA